MRLRQVVCLICLATAIVAEAKVTNAQNYDDGIFPVGMGILDAVISKCQDYVSVSVSDLTVLDAKWKKYLETTERQKAGLINLREMNRIDSLKRLDSTEASLKSRCFHSYAFINAISPSIPVQLKK